MQVREKEAKLGEVLPEWESHRARKAAKRNWTSLMIIS
jgi:hypothetical protein